MVFVACGLNHKTAPLSLREKVALPAAVHASFINNLLEIPEINEAAILSTCNRSEIYCDTNDPKILATCMAYAHEIPYESLSPYLYPHEGEQGIKHTLRVAAGLDSMMIGEPQILGQLKQAYQQACQLGSIKTQLKPVFQYVFNARKRIRTLSGIGSNPTSVAYAAVQLVGKLFSNVACLKVLLIGSGETAALVAKYLHQQGVHHFTVASRSLGNAQQLANVFAANTLAITDIAPNLFNADIVISATACPVPFINKAMVERALNQRSQKPMFFLDLAVPRDIEADVAELEKVHLYNIDDLQLMIEKGLDEKRNAALHAEALIETELNNYTKWHRSIKAKDLICNYRQSMQNLAQQETQRALKKLAAGHNQQQVFIEFSEQLIQKLLHNPTTGIRNIAWDGREDLLSLAQYLFP